MTIEETTGAGTASALSAGFGVLRRNKMIRFVIRRKLLDRHSGLASEWLETVDCECLELERVLMGGGTDMNAYDYRELAGAEVLPPPSAEQGLLREALAWLENSKENAPSL